MRNTLAERILALFTARDRAATMVGDFAETASTRGTLWFWRAVASAVSRLAVWPAALFVACVLIQFATWAAATMVLKARGPSQLEQLIACAVVLLSSVVLYVVSHRRTTHLVRGSLVACALSLAVLVSVAAIGRARGQRPVVSFPEDYVLVVAAQWLAFRCCAPERISSPSRS
jgi:hypothetical protein